MRALERSGTYARQLVRPSRSRVDANLLVWDAALHAAVRPCTLTLPRIKAPVQMERDQRSHRTSKM